MLLKLQVGQKVPPPLFEGQQGCHLHPNPLTLVFAYRDVVDSEVAAFRDGACHFYAQELEGLISVITHIDRLGWGDALFVPQSALDAFQPPDDNLNTGYGVTMLLVEATTGILKAMRLIGLGHEFSRGLYEMWSRSKDLPQFTQADFNARAATVMQRFPTPQSLAPRARYEYRQRGR